jgi:uncharacterized linocin/CFP29 family protein
MPNTLGRDEMWNQEIWKSIDDAVLAEVGRVRVAQKIFPGWAADDAQFVPADVVVDNPREPLHIEEGHTKPLIEISSEFILTQAQVDDETHLHAGRSLARLAAKEIALAEDMLFFQGRKAPVPKRVKVVNRDAAGDGLLNLKGIHVIEVKAPDRTKPDEYGVSTFHGVVEAIAHLTSKAETDPYALLLATDIYADAFAPLGGTLATTADRLTPVLSGGLYGSGTLPPKTGFVISLGGEPTSLYVGQDATTAYTQPDDEGHARFRVFERVQVVARDPDAFVRLDFK